MVRNAARLGLMTLGAVLLALSFAPIAHAHIRLSSSNPSNDQVLENAPSDVQLSFSKDVGGSLDSVRVLDSNGNEVGGEPSTDGSIVIVPMNAKTPGVYFVAWRVLGPDGHPISGDFQFSVHETLDTSPETTSANPHAGHPMGMTTYPRQALDKVNTAARVLYYIALLIVVGGAIFATVIAPGWRPRFFRRAAMMVVFTSITIFGINLALIGEHSIWGVINPLNVVPHVLTPVGRITALSALLSFYLFRIYPQLKEGVRKGEMNPRRRVFVAAILLAVVPSLGGHASASEYALIRIPFDMLHIVAASIWFGGIIQLQGVSKPYLATHPAVFPAVVRYSRVAFVAVGVLVVTGLFAAWAEIGMSIKDLFGTTYGRLVVAKAGLLVLTMPLANANRSRNVPALVERSRSASGNLRRYVMFEVLILLLVIAATAWLVYEMPPREMRSGPSHSGHTMS